MLVDSAPGSESLVVTAMAPTSSGPLPLTHSVELSEVCDAGCSGSITQLLRELGADVRRLVVEFASPNVHHKLLHSETKSHCNSHTFDQLETSGKKNPLEILKKTSQKCTFYCG